MRAALRHAQNSNEREAKRRRFLDEDRTCWWHISSDSEEALDDKPPVIMRASGANSTNCARDIARGEYVWRITGFSWLKRMIDQNNYEDDDQQNLVASQQFHLGAEKFVFRYNPWAGELREGYNGSLAIVPITDNRILLRYRIYVKARSGKILQWGETRDVVHEYVVAAYGPDVHWPGRAPESLGIFGLSHEELLQSEWVENDALTMKFELEVRPEVWAESGPLGLAGEVPEPTMSDDTQTLLEEGKCCDVRFMVQGEVIHAHSQILCARSEALSKQLTAGMQESVSKVIVIEDCDVTIFRAVLQFLYTDRLPDAKELLPKRTSSESENESGSLQLSRIQRLLAVSDKYQIKRLQLWCQAKLSDSSGKAARKGLPLFHQGQHEPSTHDAFLP